MEFSQSGGLLDLLRNAPDLGQSSRGLRGGVAGLSHALRTGDTSNLLRDLAPIGFGAAAAATSAMAPGIGTAGRLALGGLATPVAMGLSRYALEQQDPGMRDESWKEILANAGGPQISDEANMLAEAVLDPIAVGTGVAGIGAAGALADTMLGGRNATTLDTFLEGTRRVGPGNVATDAAGITPEAMVAAQQVGIPKTIRATGGGQLDEAQLANLFDTMYAKGMLDEVDVGNFSRAARESGLVGDPIAADTPIPRQPNFQPVQSLGSLEPGAATPTRTMDPYLAMNSIEREIDTAGQLGQTLQDFHPDQRQILRQLANERLGKMRMAQRGGPTPTQMAGYDRDLFYSGAPYHDVISIETPTVLRQEKGTRKTGIGPAEPALIDKEELMYGLPDIDDVIAAQRGGPTPAQMVSSQKPTQLVTGAANEDTLQMIKAHVMEQKLARQRGLPRESSAIPGDTGMPQRTQAAPEQLPMAEIVDQAPDPITRQLPGTMPPPSASPHRMLYPRTRGGEVSTANIDAMAGRGMGGLPKLPEGVRGVRGYKPSQATDDYLVNQVDKILKYDYSVGGANGAKELMRRAIDGRLPTDPQVIQSLQLMYQRSGNRPDIQHYVGATLRQLAVNVGAKSDAFVDGLEVLQAQPRMSSGLDDLRMLQQNPEIAYFDKPESDSPVPGGKEIEKAFSGSFNSGQRLPAASEYLINWDDVQKTRLNIGGNQVTDQLALQRELAGQQVPGGNVANQAQDAPIYQFADQAGQTTPEAVAQAQTQTQAAPAGNVATPAAAEQAYQNIFASDDPRWTKSVLEAMVKNQEFLSREETQDMMSFLNRLKDDVKARYKMDPTTQGNLFTEFKNWAKTEDTAGINPYVKQIADELGIKTYDEEMGPAARRYWMSVFDPGYKGSPMHSKNAALPGQKKGKSGRNILPRDLAANLVFSDTPGKPLGPKDQVVAMALDYKPAGQQGHALRVFRTSVADVAHEMKEWFSKNQSIVDAMDQGRKRAETLANYFENGIVPDSWIVAAENARVKFIADQSATAKKKLYDKLADVWTYAGIKSSNQNAIQSLADALMVHAAQLTGDKRIINAALAGAAENGVLLADVDATLKATKNAASPAGKAARELFEILNDPGNAPSPVKEGMKDMVPGTAAATPETRGPDVPVTEQAALEAPATPEDLTKLEAGLSAAVNLRTGEIMPYDTIRILLEQMAVGKAGFRNKLNETVATLDKAYDLTELKRAFGMGDIAPPAAPPETVATATSATPAAKEAATFPQTDAPWANDMREAMKYLNPTDRERILRSAGDLYLNNPESQEFKDAAARIFGRIRDLAQNSSAEGKAVVNKIAKNYLQATVEKPFRPEAQSGFLQMPGGYEGDAIRMSELGGAGQAEGGAVPYLGQVIRNPSPKTQMGMSKKVAETISNDIVSNMAAYADEDSTLADKVAKAFGDTLNKGFADFTGKNIKAGLSFRKPRHDINKATLSEIERTLTNTVDKMLLDYLKPVEGLPQYEAAFARNAEQLDDVKAMMIMRFRGIDDAYGDLGYEFAKELGEYAKRVKGFPEFPRLGREGGKNIIPEIEPLKRVIDAIGSNDPADRAVYDAVSGFIKSYYSSAEPRIAEERLGQLFSNKALLEDFRRGMLVNLGLRMERPAAAGRKADRLTSLGDFAEQMTQASRFNEPLPEMPQTTRLS